MYVNDFASLAVGRTRYRILLRDDCFMYDDSVIARIAYYCVHVTTTTVGAARVFAFMEDYLQTEWPGLRAWLTSTTEQWSVIAVQGPRARYVLFFFSSRRRHTRWNCDWSSDVCSSDLAESSRELARLFQAMGRNQEALTLLNSAHRLFGRLDARRDLVDVDAKRANLEDTRSEERRVGKECRSGRAPCQ